MSPFSSEVKRQIRERQDNRCAICGDRVNLDDILQCHHKIPENALLPLGIRGKCNPDNGVALCGEKARDCHQIADMKAIKEHLFFKDGKFVPFNEIDPKQYDIVGKVRINQTEEQKLEYQIKRETKRTKKDLKKLRKQISQESLNYYIDPNDINADVKFRK